jgi:NTE family protein
MSDNTPDNRQTRPYSIGLALGGGGARGLAHITVLEAFDELGIRPGIVAGSSMGALVAVAFAAGMSARDIADFALSRVSSRAEIARRLIGGGLGDLFKLVDFSGRLTAQLDAQHLVDLFLPDTVPARFDQLDIPALVIATDYYRRDAHIFSDGALKPALAASIALPGIMKPRLIDGRVMIDGAIASPLPFDILIPHADHIIAIDVTGGPIDEPAKLPNQIDLLFRTTQIMQLQIVAAKLRSIPAEVLITPDVDRFRVLEFHRIREIFESAAPAKEQLKHALDKLLTASP